MSTELVASARVLAKIGERGGALYVWPRKARCCGGTITLEAATEPPEKAFRQVAVEGIDLFVPVGMALPRSLHVELSRRGRIRAFWNGLAWVDATPGAIDPIPRAGAAAPDRGGSAPHHH
jgi:hypothetical protein